MSSPALLGLIAALAPAAWLPAPHDGSRAFSELRVAGAEVQHELALQATSILEVLPLDTDGDGRIGTSELEAGRPILAAYLLDRYRLSVGSGGLAGGGTRLEGELIAARTELPPTATGWQWVELELVWRSTAPLEELGIESYGFYETSPTHMDSVRLDWNSRARLRCELWSGEPYFHVGPANLPPPPTAVTRLVGGLSAAGLAWTTALLFLALAAGARTGRQAPLTLGLCLAGIALAFVAAALGLVQVPPRPVALVASLAAPYVAANNLTYRSPRRLEFEGAGFGLAHGLALAIGFAPLAVADPAHTAALAGHLAGLLAGLVTAAVLALALARHLPGARAAAAPGEPSPWLAPTWWRRFASAAALVLGLTAFIEAAWGWVPWG